MFKAVLQFIQARPSTNSVDTTNSGGGDGSNEDQYENNDTELSMTRSTTLDIYTKS